MAIQNDNPKNFKPQKPEDAFGEKQKNAIVNKEATKPVHKKEKTVGAKQNKKPNPTAMK